MTEFTFKKFHKYILRGKGGNSHVVIPIEDRKVPALIYQQYLEVPFSNTTTQKELGDEQV